MTTTARDTVDGIFDGLEGLTIDTHERVHFHHDEATGLSAIIAVHDTRLGPALGGTRFYPYASGGDALTDVLRLSEGMTYKAAAAGLDLGGGKAVIVGDPSTLKSPACCKKIYKSSIRRLARAAPRSRASPPAATRRTVCLMR